MALRVEDIDLAADRELVERWQAGEHDVFDDLYRRYFRRLQSYCHKRVGDRDTAEEIAQEAFAKALQALPKLSGERRFYPWVTVIASRLCVDHHRRLGRVKPSDEIDAGTVEGDHDARLSLLADIDNLDRAMQRLGPRHVEVLELREREGLSYSQIAERLDVPHSTVEALLFRARKALRREFFAVSGEGSLASIPVIGALLRRLAAGRDRIAELMPSLSQLSAPLAAGAVAIVASVPSMSGPAAVAASPPASLRSPTPHVVSTSTPELVEQPGEREPAAEWQAPVTTARAAPGIETTGETTAREEADDMPVSVEAGPVSAGADPMQIVDWLPLGGSED